MKFFSAMFLALLTSTAAAQPGPRPAPVPAPVPAAPAAPTPTVPAAPGATPAAIPAVPGGQDPAVPTTNAGAEVLTLEIALEIAMRQQPELRLSQAQVETAAGRVDLARIARRPTVRLDASVGAGNRPNDFFSHQEGTGLGASASWQIYDFGQTAAIVRAAELSADAATAALGTATLDIRTTVETTYLEAVARRRLVEVAAATVRSEDAHLDQARRFVAAQAKDPIEVAQAQARDANAKSALAQAQSDEAIALANLRSAIGWVDPTRSPVVSPDWPSPSEADPPDLAALVGTAR